MTRLMVPKAESETAVPVAGDGSILVRQHTCTGTPKANLMLCHGNGFAIDAYAPFWAPLLAEYSLFVFDLRHHGRNDPAAEWLTGFETYASDYDRIVAWARSVSSDLPLIGTLHSVSAITALYHAAHSRTLLDGLILFDPPMQPPEGHPNHRMAFDFEHKLADWARARPTQFQNPQALADQFGRSRSLSGWIDGAHRLMADSILKQQDDGMWGLRCPPEAEAQNYIANAELTTWDLFDRIEVPLALISADPEHPAGQSPAKVCAALNRERGIPLIAIPGTSHMLQIEKPEACRQAFSDSLRHVL